MCAVVFVLAVLSLVPTYATSGCGTIPTSIDDVLTYSSTKSCEGRFQEKRITSLHNLLVDCNGYIATVRLDKRTGGGIDIITKCTLSNGTCDVQDSFLSASRNSMNVSLQKNSTSCVFAACFVCPTTTYPIHYVNVTECTFEIDDTGPTSTVSVISPTPSLPSDTPTPSSLTISPTPSPPTTINKETIAVSFAVAFVVLITTVALLILFIMIFKMRSPSTFMHDMIFIKGDGDTVNIAIEPKNISRTVCESQETIYHSLFSHLSEQADLPPQLEREAPLTAAEVKHANILAQEEVTKLSQSSDDNSSDYTKKIEDIVEDKHSYLDKGVHNENISTIIYDHPEIFSGDLNLEQTVLFGSTTSVKYERMKEQEYSTHGSTENLPSRDSEER